MYREKLAAAQLQSRFQGPIGGPGSTAAFPTPLLGVTSKTPLGGGKKRRGGDHSQSGGGKSTGQLWPILAVVWLFPAPYLIGLREKVTRPTKNKKSLRGGGVGTEHLTRCYQRTLPFPPRVGNEMCAVGSSMQPLVRQWVASSHPGLQGGMFVPSII
jgi:hypothetical protein